MLKPRLQRITPVAAFCLAAGCAGSPLDSPSAVPLGAPAQGTPAETGDGARSGEAGAPPEAGQPNTSVPGPTPTPCTNAKRYYVVSAERECAEVKVDEGQWSFTSLFPGAPEYVTRHACAYTWSGRLGASPNQAALEAALGKTYALTPVCEPALPTMPVLALAEPTDIVLTVPSSGSVGCDVCGIVWGDRMWLVIAPSILHKHTEVMRASGAIARFNLAFSAARAATAALPAGGADAYVNGFVRVY